MSTQVAAESPWPEVGQKDPNPSAHGRKIQNEISAMMECASRMTKKGKAKAYPQAKTNALFKSILEFIEKVPGEPAGAIHPEATTKGDLDALAAKILEAVSFQSRVSPTASRTKSFVEALTTNSPPQSYPQSVLSRMTPTSAAPISSRKLREVRVVKMANEGIERAGLFTGPGRNKAIEMATVQVSGDYLLIAKDAATAERLTKNGPQWVTCLGGNAEVVTPVYTVMVMNIPVSTFNPQEQEQMRHTLIGSNYQLLADHKINHMDWMMKPRQGKATGTIVISFMTKAGANAAIAAGILAWEGQAKRTISSVRDELKIHSRENWKPDKHAEKPGDGFCPAPTRSAQNHRTKAYDDPGPGKESHGEPNGNQHPGQAVRTRIRCDRSHRRQPAQGSHPAIGATGWLPEGSETPLAARQHKDTEQQCL
ncbi:hypothetical protein KCU81_g10079, partial [Aureobasidium melanogenum]